MMRRAWIVLLLSCLPCMLANRAEARAPDTFEEDFHEPIIIDSPMWFALEVKLGPYQPSKTQLFETVFENDRGWMLNVELDFTVYHIPYVGQLNAAAGWGWAKYDAHTPLANGTGVAGETTEFTVYPLSALGVLRVDSLARYTVVPLVFAGKVGYEWVRWKGATGSAKAHEGLNDGLRVGVQGALELDFLARGGARQLDEDWGINHVLLLVEYYKSATNGVGDKTFSLGLGFQF